MNTFFNPLFYRLPHFTAELIKLGRPALKCNILLYQMHLLYWDIKFIIIGVFYCYIFFFLLAESYLLKTPEYAYAVIHMDHIIIYLNIYE